MGDDNTAAIDDWDESGDEDYNEDSDAECLEEHEHLEENSFLIDASDIHESSFSDVLRPLYHFSRENE